MSDAQDVSNDVKKFDFKLPEHVDLRNSIGHTIGAFGSIILAGVIGMYVADTEGENTGIVAGIVAYLVILFIFSLLFPKKSDEKLSKITGSKNEIENDNVLESCESLSDLWDALRNTQLSFLVKEKNGNT